MMHSCFQMKVLKFQFKIIKSKNNILIKTTIITTMFFNNQNTNLNLKWQLMKLPGSSPDESRLEYFNTSETKTL